MERKIASLLPKKFSLVFDGWTAHATHYLGVFASPPANNRGGFLLSRLAFSPFEDERTLGRDEHIEIIMFVLSLFKKDWTDVVCLIGDN